MCVSMCQCVCVCVSMCQCVNVCVWESSKIKVTLNENNGLGGQKRCWLLFMQIKFMHFFETPAPPQARAHERRSFMTLGVQVRLPFGPHSIGRMCRRIYVFDIFSHCTYTLEGPAPSEDMPPLPTQRSGWHHPLVDRLRRRAALLLQIGARRGYTLRGPGTPPKGPQCEIVPRYVLSMSVFHFSIFPFFRCLCAQASSVLKLIFRVSLYRRQTNK